MPCKRIGNIILCYNRAYRYKGFNFEISTACGPVQLRKDLEPRVRIQAGFYDAFAEFYKLSENEKEDYLIEQ